MRFLTFCNCLKHLRLAVIERQFEHTVTEPGNLEVHAGAFFITTPEDARNFGKQIINGQAKILVK